MKTRSPRNIPVNARRETAPSSPPTAIPNNPYPTIGGPSTSNTLKASLMPPGNPFKASAAQPNCARTSAHARVIASATRIFVALQRGDHYGEIKENRDEAQDDKR